MLLRRLGALFLRPLSIASKALLLAALALGCARAPGEDTPAPAPAVASAPTPVAMTPARAAPAPVVDWNDAAIAWQPFEEGLAAAKRDKKPVCLVLYTEWCPHCKSYHAVFHDQRIVDQAKRFVMIRVDKDKAAEVSKRFAPDGEYIPRTIFLSSQGEMDASVHAPREKFKFFYDEKDAASLLGGMTEALRKLH